MHSNKINLDQTAHYKRYNQFEITPIEDGEKFMCPASKGSYELVSVDTNRISYKFASLRSDKDMLDFAHEYGLLGLQSRSNMYIREDHASYLMNYAMDNSPTHVESLKEWRIHAEHVRKLIKLYKAIRNNENVNNNILYVDELRYSNYADMNQFISKRRKILNEPGYQLNISDVTFLEQMHYETKNNAANLSRLLSEYKDQKHPKQIRQPAEQKSKNYYFWSDGKPTLVDFKEQIPNTDEGYQIIAFLILQFHLKIMMKQYIYVDFSQPSKKTNIKSVSDISYSERKVTPFLLTAIYYDLWRIVNRNEPVEECDICGNPFQLRRKGSKYCSNACKQRGYRNTKEKSND